MLTFACSLETRKSTRPRATTFGVSLFSFFDGKGFLKIFSFIFPFSSIAPFISAFVCSFIE